MAVKWVLFVASACLFCLATGDIAVGLTPYGGLHDYGHPYLGNFEYGYIQPFGNGHVNVAKKGPYASYTYSHTTGGFYG